MSRAARCPGRTRHWRIAFGTIGMRTPVCAYCGSPNPVPLSDGEWAELVGHARHHSVGDHVRAAVEARKAQDGAPARADGEQAPSATDDGEYLAVAEFAALPPAAQRAVWQAHAEERVGAVPASPRGITRRYRRDDVRTVLRELEEGPR